MSDKIGKLYVCTARVELTVFDAFTLKDRRAVVKSLAERLKGKYNLAVADLDGGERGASRAALGLASAANAAGIARETVEKAIEFVVSDGRVEMGEVEVTEM